VSLKNLVVFDMDGVLVDVTESYRAAIQSTVAHFTGRQITNSVIQDYKNQGGWNDDWALSQQLIKDNGLIVRHQDVVDFFQAVFLGDGANGLIRNERWLAKPGLLESFAEQSTLGVFTGRMRWEAQLTLDRFAPSLFSEVVGVDDVLHPKPAADGLLQIAERVPHAKIWYVGDSIDDAMAARDARVPFIGIASQNCPHRKKLIDILKDHGAITVIENINEMEPIVSA
jgi:HAD superfamily phosphatase